MPTYYVRVNDREIGLEVHHREEGTFVRELEANGETSPVKVDFAPVTANAQLGEGLYSLIMDGRSYQVRVEKSEEGLRLAMWWHRFDVDVLTEREWRLQKVAPRPGLHTGEMVVKAPMPGLVKGILVAVGDEVQKGQRLVVLEAMKMENDIAAAAPGKVAAIHVSAGQTVDGGNPLVTLE